MKFLKVLFVLCLLLFVLIACAPVEGVAQQVVQLPEGLQVIISGLVMAAVAWVFMQIFAAFPWLEQFLGQYVDEVATALSVAVLTWIQNVLNLIPQPWETVGNLALALILEVLIVLGFFTVGRKVKNTTQRALGLKSDPK